MSTRYFIIDLITSPRSQFGEQQAHKIQEAQLKRKTINRMSWWPWSEERTGPDSMHTLHWTNSKGKERDIHLGSKGKKPWQYDIETIRKRVYMSRRVPGSDGKAIRRTRTMNISKCYLNDTAAGAVELLKVFPRYRGFDWLFVFLLILHWSPFCV